MLNLTTFKDTRNYLNSIGLPGSDNEQPVVCQQFSTGGHYGIELSSMNNFKIISRGLELAKQYKIKIARLIECRGIVRLPDNEIRSMVQICEDNQVGLIMSIGPRAISDIGAFAQSPNGKRIGYRLRGMENIVYAIEDVKRAIDLGVRGFLIYDEGLLVILNKMRQESVIPQNIVFKYSVHAGCSNPLSAKLLEDNGADTINVIPDLEFGMVNSFRKTIKAPLDIFSDTSKEAGGLLRTYAMPDMIRLASPVYLKCGPISQPAQNHLPSENELEERVKQTKCVVEHIERHLPEAKAVSSIDPTIGLPNSVIKVKESAYA